MAAFFNGGKHAVGGKQEILRETGVEEVAVSAAVSHCAGNNVGYPAITKAICDRPYRPVEERGMRPMENVAMRKSYEKPVLRKSLVLLQSVTAQSQSQQQLPSG